MKAKKLIGFLFVGAVVLLAGCGGDKAKMLQQLEQLEQQNRSGEAMLNDSLAESLVNYFDRHGDANERMRSRYILGRTYYCLEELPRALEMYNEAADCADTMSADCNYKVLSRIHAQSAIIFNLQVQPRSQLQQLRLAERYAWKGKDTLQAIECYAQQGDAYDFLKMPDSVIIIKSKASTMFRTIGLTERSAQVIGPAISSLIELGNKLQAKSYIDIYEKCSGLFDDNGNIEKGREIHYYVRGEYYMAMHQLDSAEYMFRKELLYGKDLNNQIAGCKGLQKVYEQRRNSDSIAKYATLSYELNDSAYLLSEMQNIQEFQASYNYNHHKQLAEKESREARNAKNAIWTLVCFVVLVGIIVFLLLHDIKKEKVQQRKLYLQTHESLEKAQTELLELKESNVTAESLISRKVREVEDLQTQLAELRKNAASKDHANLEKFLQESDIVKELTGLLEVNPIRPATQDQMKEVKKLINEQIPVFYDTLNSTTTLRPIEYEVCLLVRCHFKPSSIGKLLGLDEAYVSNVRRRILHKVYGIEGNPKDLDERIMAIV